MTTVGYGDYYPSTAWGQLVTSALILTTVVLVPYQTNQLLKVISEQAVWDKHSYFERKGHRHVLVAGCVNNNGLENFVHEFFNADQVCGGGSGGVARKLSPMCLQASAAREGGNGVFWRFTAHTRALSLGTHR